MSFKNIKGVLLQGLVAFVALVVAPVAFGFQNAISASANGQIQGQVVLDTSGSPLASATVTVYRTNPAPSVSATAVTGATGSFTISGLPTGTFGICVNTTQANLLDPCQWTDFQTTVAVSSGSATSAVLIRVKPSSPFKLRITDAAQALIPASSNSTHPHVLVGVFDLKGVFHPAAEAKDSLGVSYQVSIPFDYPVRLSVYSAQVTLKTSQNAVVPAQGFTQVVLQASNQPQLGTVTLVTTGHK